MHDVEVEQLEEESQSNQERSESHDDEESQGVEEEQVQVEMENQRNHAPFESSGDEEEGQDEEAEQAEDVPEDGGFQKGSSKPALAPPLSKRATIANMTLDEDTLDCGVCFLPLKRPIFQCDVGHVVCSSCRDKLAPTRRCHMCCAPLARGYRRCHAMEQLVESIRGSCPNAPYGCTVRMAYYDQHPHLQVCRHAPCHCPAEACGFVGSTEALLDHFVVAHKWPCTTGVKVSVMRDVELHDGLNVVSVVHDARQYLFLKIVARTPLGRAISCLCIHPPQVAAAGSLQLTSKNVKWRLKLSYSHDVVDADDHFFHIQNCSFRVACTDLSGGMPNPNECFQFVVPSSVQPDAEATVKVTVDFSIL
ncbi:hypothetical protein BRADI_2g35472v3 [Brachypodium distachyon]|uniref:RING-type E3 ubiquitin transferase n=1 Tax=Brachypodium distachyon TaxID=15368 RepID=A0A2K2DBY2_BRADI|nr:hypothetical protein BRADI_2g35472v3 [Brachypodium distachyon]